MKWTTENLWTIVTDCTDDEQAWMYHTLSWKDAKAARFTRNRDPYTRMYNPSTGTFPAGLTRQVYEAALAAGMVVSITDARKKPCTRDAAADLAWLRWYQVEAVEAAVRRTRGVIWAPTGSGKTEIAIGLTLALPCKWLFLADRGDLVAQAAARYALRTGVQATMVDSVDNLSDGLNIGTFQLFWARVKKGNKLAEKLLGQADGLLVDECHILPAASYTKVAHAAANAYYRIGLSGTPSGGEKKILVQANLGPILYRILPQTLIDEGVLAKPVIRMLPCHQTIELPPAIGNRALAKLWAMVNNTLVIDSEERNNLIVDAIVNRAKKPALCFVTQTAHGEAIQKAVAARGVSCAYVDGRASVPRRQAAIKRLEYGEIDVLIATTIFNQGIDIPGLESVIIAAGGQSVIAAIQRVGRGMRTDSGRKMTFEVWDIADTGSLLEKHTKARVKAYEAEGFSVADGVWD